jgi:prepilin signal peptidase PulO-like enzyme (type II secretory pathway)
MILISLWLWFIPQHIPSFFINFILFTYFGVVVVIDIEYRLILHHVSLVGLGIGIIVGYFLHGIVPTLIGGLTGFLGMLLLYYFGTLFSKAISHWRHEEIEEEALGFGDVNLSGVLGLILGWPGITLGLVGAILIGGIISFIYLIYLLITRRYHSFAAFPYGPCLIASAVFFLYFRQIL